MPQRSGFFFSHFLAQIDMIIYFFTAHLLYWMVSHNVQCLKHHIFNFHLILLQLSHLHTVQWRNKQMIISIWARKYENYFWSLRHLLLSFCFHSTRFEILDCEGGGLPNAKVIKVDKLSKSTLGRSKSFRPMMQRTKM